LNIRLQTHFIYKCKHQGVQSYISNRIKTYYIKYQTFIISQLQIKAGRVLITR